MTMQVCVELGKTEEEISHWALEDLFRWHAFFRIRNKLIDKNTQPSSSNSYQAGNKTTTVIIE